MKRIALICVTLSVTIMGYSANGQWQEMFNGKNFKGWEKLDGSAEYRIENGEIIGTSKTGTPNSFMATKKIYGDFILEYEMKMDRGVNGYQVECDDHADRPWVGGIYEEADRGWLYPMSYNQDSYKSFGPGEWNQFRIEAIGNTIRTYINGVSFANLVDDARPEGFIALQVHGIGDKQELEGKEIRWKNIRILTESLELEQHKDRPLSPEVSFLDNQLTENQISQGWELLWDGKTTDGWRGAKLDEFPEKG